VLPKVEYPQTSAAMTPEAIQVLSNILTPLLHFAIACVMVRRKLLTTFPVFFGYIVFHLVRHLAEMASMTAHPVAYFWIWWGAEGVDAVLILAVIQELFTVMFEPYEALRQRGVTIFRWSTIILCIGAGTTAIVSPASETNQLMSKLFVLDRSVQIVQLGLLFFLFVICKIFGMTWRHYVFGIASGFLLMTAISTANFAVRAHEGQIGNVLWNSLGPLGFMLGEITWMCYFASEKSLVPLNTVPRTTQLIAWNDALSKARQR
jgi:hypothetical protein